MTVTARPTPNPDALMFRIDGGTALDSGLLAFHSAGEAAGDALGAALFALDGVASVLVVPAFVTVTKRPEADWRRLETDVRRLVAAHVEARAAG